MNISDITVGQRVQIGAYEASQLPTRYGTVARIDPHHSGMCPVSVTLDMPHERLGADWAFSPSSLKSSPDAAEMARRCDAHDAALDAGKPSPFTVAEMSEAYAWLRTCTDADIDRAMAEAATRAADHRAALIAYRDSRYIHVRTLKRWKAALRSTDGNPTVEVLATMPPVEVRRDAVEQACQMARLALVATRQRMAAL